MKKAHSHRKHLSELGFPVLLCPLTVAPEGMNVGAKMATGNMAFQPVFCIPDAATIGENANKNEPGLVSRFRDLLPRLFDEVNETTPESQMVCSVKL